MVANASRCAVFVSPALWFKSNARLKRKILHYQFKDVAGDNMQRTILCHFIRGNAVPFCPPSLQQAGREETAAWLAEGKVLKSTVAETCCRPAHSTHPNPPPAASGPV